MIFKIYEGNVNHNLVCLIDNTSDSTWWNKIPNAQVDQLILILLSNTTRSCKIQ